MSDVRYGFIGKFGNVLSGEEGIIPIFSESKGKIVFLGTGFFITQFGLALTAKHCLLNNDNKYYKSLFIIQSVGEKQVVVRPIVKSYDNASDIAVLVPREMISKIDGKPLTNHRCVLTLKKQEIGEEIVSYAYPNTTLENEEELLKVNIKGEWHTGKIEEFHETGISFLKNNCYQTSMHIKAGSSGGPVANSKGSFFALNSTGADVASGVAPYSLLTPIADCLDILVEDVDDKRFSIKDLIDLGYIALQD
jgi:S1-C subfamily serine protease